MITYEGLNGAQIEVVKHGLGPCVVAAPAGSGKTRCFVTRIARLLFESGVEPGAVLGVTFTKAAATDMKNRLKDIVPMEWHADLKISTIHSLCWGIVSDADPGLREQMRNADNFLPPGYMTRKILEEFIRDFGTTYNFREVKLSYFTAAFTLAKNYHVKPQGSAEFFSGRGLQGAMLEDAYRYFERKRLSFEDGKTHYRGRHDFDDLLVLAAEMLANSPALASRWGRKFQYILVDEVQDTSPVQFEIIELLTRGGNHNNVMLVGDLRQSIYGFRGAFPQYIQKFTDDNNARVINLQINYRSKPAIVDFANRIAQQMHDIDSRFREDMISGRG